MNRGELRVLLKELLLEPADEIDDFRDARMNSYLNSGLAYVESKILAIDPAAFIAIDSFGLIADQDLYPVPSGAISILRLNQPKRMRFVQEAVVARENENGATAAVPLKYGRLGRYLRFGPKPSVTTPGAIQITYVPTLTMATDTDLPGIHENLHWLVALRAAILGYQGGDKERISGMLLQLSRGVDEIGAYYRPIADGATYLRPDYDIIDGDDAFGFDSTGVTGTRE